MCRPIGDCSYELGQVGQRGRADVAADDAGAFGRDRQQEVTDVHAQRR